MPMGIDKAGEDRLARDIDDASAGGYRNARGGADRGDSVAVHQDRPVLDYLVAVHGDDPGIGERYRAGRMRGRGGEAKMGYCDRLVGNLAIEGGEVEPTR